MANIIYKNLDDFLGHRSDLDESMPEKAHLPVYEEFCKKSLAPIGITVTVPPKWLYKRRIWCNRQIDNQRKILSELIVNAIKDSVKDVKSGIDYYVFFEMHRNGHLHAHGTLYIEGVIPHPYYCRKIQDKFVKYGLKRVGVNIEYVRNRTGWNDYIRKDYGKVPQLRPLNGNIIYPGGEADLIEQSEAPLSGAKRTTSKIK